MTAMSLRPPFRSTNLFASVLFLAALFFTGCGGTSAVSPTAPSAVSHSASTATATPDGTASDSDQTTSSAVHRCGRDDLRMDIVQLSVLQPP